MRRWQLTVLSLIGIGGWLILTFVVVWHHRFEQVATKDHKEVDVVKIEPDASKEAESSSLFDRPGVVEQYTEILNLAAAVQPREERARPHVLICLAASQLRQNASKSLWIRKKGDQRVVAITHIPKAGGTALTTALRRFACEANDGKANSCCQPPGFCQKAKGKNRLCPVILGCHGHEPTLRTHIAQYPSIRAVTVLRDPRTRLISAWFYRCHNMNFDCFQVRGAIPWQVAKRYARGIATSTDLALLHGKRNHTFLEYLHGWPQYHNIQTRMLGRYASPYASESPPLNQIDLDAAISLLDSRFILVGVFELFDHVVALLSLLADVPLKPIDFIRVRATHSPAYHDFVKALRSAGSELLEDAVRVYDHLDLKLHDYAARRLCSDLRESKLIVSSEDPSFYHCSKTDADQRQLANSLNFCEKKNLGLTDSTS